MKNRIKWFEWGDEEIGYVSTWTVGPDGGVLLGARIRKEEARARGYEYECPYN